MAARVLVEWDGHVAVVVIDNPPINGGSAKVGPKLLEAIDTVARDESIVAAVLIGAGTTSSQNRSFGSSASRWPNHRRGLARGLRFGGITKCCN